MLRSLSRALAEVEADRLARSRERVPEVEARARAGLVGAGRHHRRDLLGGERVVVARDLRALAGQVLQEQRQLIAERAVQADLAVGAPRHLHALLQLLLAAGADRDRERRSEQRRSAGGLQVGEQVARLLRALVAEVGDALLAVGLRLDDLVGVLDPPPRDPQRQAVRQEARVQRKVDAERQRLRRREHQLHARARELRLLGQRAQHQLRLPARAGLRLDPQRAAAVLDVAVHPAHHVALQRRQRRLAVALEHERARLVQPVERRARRGPGRTRGGSATAAQPRAPGGPAGSQPGARAPGRRAPVRAPARRPSARGGP